MEIENKAHNDVYDQLFDGEGVAMPANEMIKFACCDCGLVHQLALVPSRDRKLVGFAVQRDHAATLRRRELLGSKLPCTP